MNPTRWDPMTDLVSLREAMGSLLEESFVRPRAGTPANAPAGLALDVQETPAAFKVVASVPGVGTDDVEITVFGDTIRIRGERREQHEEGDRDGRWLIRERRFGAFERSVTLPATVRADVASADFDDGVLTVTLPKAEEAKPRRIAVRGSASHASTQPREIEVGSAADPTSEGR